MIQLTQLKKNLESDKKDDYIHQIKFSEFWVRFYDFEKFQIANKHLKIYPDLKKVKMEKIYKQIPSDLFRGFNQLTNINLSGNQFIVLSKDIFKDQINLVEIDLINNALETLHPETFRNCVSLKIINIKGNKLKNLDENIFQGLINLESLYLSENLLTELHPNTFNCCTHLSHLNLAYNQLETLDENIFIGLSIKIFNVILSGNRFTQKINFNHVSNQRERLYSNINYIRKNYLQ